MVERWWKGKEGTIREMGEIVEPLQVVKMVGIRGDRVGLAKILLMVLDLQQPITMVDIDERMWRRWRK